MANDEHIKLLREGVEKWNYWRDNNPDIIPDLRDAEFNGFDLRRVNLTDANLSYAILDGAKLAFATVKRASLVAASFRNVDLQFADLEDANAWGAIFDDSSLRHANFFGANLSEADFEEADLTSATIAHATFFDTKLLGANLDRAIMLETIFADVDLKGANGLELCVHMGPSSIDYRTLVRSGPLPLEFLRGIGLPDNFIEYLPSVLNQPIQHFSCFISYSTKDQSFADRLYADLQNKDVRCWFAPHDMPIGARILDEIDAAIRLRDKVLLILSEHSIKSDWVEDEVTKAFEEERKRGQTVLFPIRLDDAIMETNEAWAAKLRARHIGDFRRWKEHDEYQKSFERVLRDLTMKKP
jgi:TIR domain/Pentapeptide repeats (8 copies)